MHVFPESVLAYKKMYDFLLGKEIPLLIYRGETVICHEPEEQGMIYYARHGGSEKRYDLAGDMEIVLAGNFSNYGFDTGEEDVFLDQQLAEKGARCLVRCCLLFTDPFLDVAVEYDALNGTGWKVQYGPPEGTDGCPGHPADEIAKHFGFKNMHKPVSEAKAFEILSAMAMCFIERYSQH